MHQWEKFNEILLPKREDFYSKLNIKDVTELGEYHDLYLKSNTFLLKDAFR